MSSKKSRKKIVEGLTAFLALGSFLKKKDKRKDKDREIETAKILGSKYGHKAKKFLNKKKKRKGGSISYSSGQSASQAAKGFSKNFPGMGG